MNYDKDRYIGYVEMALGVGDIVGPAIGGFVYEFIGYNGTFLTFGALIFVGIVFSYLWIPERLNYVSPHNSSNLETIEDQGKSHQGSPETNSRLQLPG